MKRRQPYIPQRAPIFIGCEGRSEGAYAALLAGLARDAHLPVHLEIVELAPGAGDPLARVTRAVERLARLRARRGDFIRRFILLDDDQVALAPERAEQARQLAEQNAITLIWQKPCHEAFLLRHLPGRITSQPPTTPASLQALTQAWPAYQKPMTRVGLGQRLDLAGILRVAAIEPEFAELLQCVGLLPGE